MAKSWTPLEEVRLFWDKKANAVKVTSSDPRLGGESFVIKLSPGTTADTLARGVLAEEGIDIPSSGAGGTATPESLRPFPHAAVTLDEIILGYGRNNEVVSWTIPTRSAKEERVLGIYGGGEGADIILKQLLKQAEELANYYDVCFNSATGTRYVLPLDIVKVEDLSAPPSRIKVRGCGKNGSGEIPQMFIIDARGNSDKHQHEVEKLVRQCRMDNSVVIVITDNKQALDSFQSVILLSSLNPSPVQYEGAVYSDDHVLFRKGGGRKDSSWFRLYKDVFLEEVSKTLPKHIARPDSSAYPYEKIPFGIGVDGEITWDILTDPHLLVSGMAGSGKTVVQRNILLHALQHPEQMRTACIDLTGELKPFADAMLAITNDTDNAAVAERATYANTLFDARNLLAILSQESGIRYAQMQKEGASSFKQLAGRYPAIITVIDDAGTLMDEINPAIATSEELANNRTRTEIRTMLLSLLRTGRAAGISIVLSTHAPSTIPPELRAMYATRYVTGKVNPPMSRIALGNEAAVNTPRGILGRGVIAFNNESPQEIQGYYVSPGDIPRGSGTSEKPIDRPEDESSAG